MTDSAVMLLTGILLAVLLMVWLPVIAYLCAYAIQFGRILAQFRAIQTLKGDLKNGN